MKRLCVKGILILAVIQALTGCSLINKQEKSSAKDRKSIKVGISVYDQYDTFISSIMKSLSDAAREKEKEKSVSISLDFANASGNQLLQNDQVETFIKQEYDIICINLVDRTDASVVIDMAKNADIPVIFFNRELVEEDLERFDKLYYVGAVTLEPGIMQGELIINYCKDNFSKADKNHDGRLQYVMLEGEPGHQDALVRTEYVVNTVVESGILMEKLGDEIANWNRAQSATKMNQLIKDYGENIELVIANNDDMALGAIDALKECGAKERPLVVGIDGTDVGLEAVKSGEMMGTVLNDDAGQAGGILELAYSLGFGEELSEEYELIDGKYIRLPHKIVTIENVDEIMLNY